MVRKIKLMPDYQCYPLWALDEEALDNLNPQTLPLSSETIWRLEDWAKRFDSWMNWDDPTSSIEPSTKAVVAFDEEGRRLWQRLIQELGPNYEVYYKSISPPQKSVSPWQLEATAMVNTAKVFAEDESMAPA